MDVLFVQMEVIAVLVSLALVITLHFTHAILIVYLDNILIYQKKDANHVYVSVLNVFLELHVRAVLKVQLIIQLPDYVTQIVIQHPIGT